MPNGFSNTQANQVRLENLKNFKDMVGLRCNHPLVEQVGSKYKATHLSTVQRWRASKSQGQYMRELSEAIAKAFHEIQTGAQWLKGDLDREASETTPQHSFSDGYWAHHQRARKLAIGGMRNHNRSVAGLPGMRARGAIVKKYLLKAQSVWPELKEPARAILSAHRS